MAINRLLTDKDRDDYGALIDDMFRVCPEMMRRKIPRANIQQAFVLGEVLKLFPTHTNILSVGCYDDTAYEYLMNIPHKNRIDILGIDPAINVDLKTFKSINHDKFDIIFSTSVIEHVQNDDEFLDDICKLLNKDGVGILTMDFNNDYRPGDKLPYSDVRFYTEYDLGIRLASILDDNDCELVDKPDWTGKPEFIHDGCSYSFATFVFRKIGNV